MYEERLICKIHLQIGLFTFSFILQYMLKSEKIYNIDNKILNITMRYVNVE